MEKIKKVCKQCSKIIYVRWDRVKRSKFCSRSCSSKYNSAGNRNGNSKVKIKVPCSYCMKKIFLTKCKYLKYKKLNQRHFCNKKCVDLWRRDIWVSKGHGLWWYEGKLHPKMSKQGRQSVSRQASERMIKLGHKISGIKGEYYSKKNKYKLSYDSSWELQAYQILEQMSEVISYSRCEFYIEYSWKDNIHRYIPDIKVVYKSGNIDIIEVKPLSRLLEDEIVRVKGKAADKYCKENNMNYVVWTENCVVQ